MDQNRFLTVPRSPAHRPPLTTSRYLWLGFGTSIGLLLVTCLLIVSRVGSVEGEVRKMADARNFSAATAQLETGLLRYVVSIQDHLNTGDPKHLKDAEQAADAVRQHLQEYRSASVGDRRYDLAGAFEPMWMQVHSLGQALVKERSVGRRPSQASLIESRSRLQRLLAVGMQPEALDVYNRRKDDALHDIQTAVNFTLFLMMAGTLLALATSLAIARGIIRSERNLADSQKLLRVTLGSIADGVVTTDRLGAVTYLNQAGEALTGWTAAEAMGQPLSVVLELVDESRRTPVESSAVTALRGGGVDVARDPPVLISRSRKESVVEERAAAIHDDDGAIVGAVVIIRDVTQRHRLEQELREQAAALAQADRRKTEFISMLSHELRNPLAPISNALEILRRGIDDAPRLRPAVAMMERQVTQMVRLVEDLIDISRISRGKIDLRMAPVDLSSVLQLAVESVRPLLDSNEHDLTVTLTERPVIIEADPVRLAQIVGNLLSNAAKFTQPHGSIQLKTAIENGAVAISVSDTGIGISPQHLPHVFDLYMQVDSSLGRSGSGIGLGLALVKDLVDLHGGTITASSEGVGKGTTFVVRLPLSSRVALACAREVPVASAPLQSCRVLVADDNRDALESLVSLLESDGHQVRAASDGNDALRLASEFHPDVVLLDLGMPHVDGFQAAREIRKASWGSTVGMIALTGFGQDEDRRRALRAGFDIHLVKPATLSQIRDAIHAALAARTRKPAELTT